MSFYNGESPGLVCRNTKIIFKKLRGKSEVSPIRLTSNLPLTYLRLTSDLPPMLLVVHRLCHIRQRSSPMYLHHNRMAQRQDNVIFNQTRSFHLLLIEIENRLGGHRAPFSSKPMSNRRKHAHFISTQKNVTPPRHIGAGFQGLIENLIYLPRPPLRYNLGCLYRVPSELNAFASIPR
jgi:hypothetical protein